jgi:hypothetical protein
LRRELAGAFAFCRAPDAIRDNVKTAAVPEFTRVSRLKEGGKIFVVLASSTV